MKLRDRKSAGAKTAETNRNKDPKYYEKIGSAGGAAVEAVKRAFAVVPGLAAKAALKRHHVELDQIIEYVVTDGQSTTTCSTRAHAREIKRVCKENGADAHITRYTYDFGKINFIVEAREVW